jgi:hypothetical protein
MLQEPQSREYHVTFDSESLLVTQNESKNENIAENYFTRTGKLSWTPFSLTDVSLSVESSVLNALNTDINLIWLKDPVHTAQ